MANIYVSATLGSASGPGTEAKPYKTIQAGINAMSQGDTVHVMNGTYSEVIRVKASGTASKPLTIKAYSGHSPIVDGRAGVDSKNSGLPTGPWPDNVNKKLVAPDGTRASMNNLVMIQGDYVIWD